MARIRYLKPDFFLNEELGELTPLHRLFFSGLWCQADREGRMKDRPKKLKAQILPFDDVETEKLLEDLHKNGFITRYEVEGERYIAVNNFSKHQRVHKKELKSVIPEPPTFSKSYISDPVSPGPNPSRPGFDPSRPGLGRGGMGNGEWVMGNGERRMGNGERRTENGKGGTGENHAPRREQVALGADGVWEGITGEQMGLWRKAYPAISVELELNKAAAWIQANPKQRKSNWPRFLVNWMSRAQDRARPGNSPKNGNGRMHENAFQKAQREYQGHQETLELANEMVDKKYGGQSVGNS